MKLYLIRHAQSANNVLWDGDDNTRGRVPDPEITQEGHLQAQLLGAHFAHPQAEPRQHPFNSVPQTHYGLTHVYCSLMTRSVLTAEYIANACNLKLQALPDIFEKNGVYEYDEHGQMQGLPGADREYFEQRFPGLRLPDDLNSPGWWNRPAEDDEGFLLRMRRVVDSYRQDQAQNDDCIAMVAHSDFIDQFINELMGVERHMHNYESDWVANWSFHNTSVSRVDFINGSHTVVYLNRIDHLPPELVTW